MRLVIVSLFLLSLPAYSKVTLSASPVDGFPSLNVTPGSSFTILVTQTSTTEKTTGNDFVLQASTSDLFRLTARDYSVGPFTTPIAPDSALVLDENFVPQYSIGALTPESSLLSPANTTDLGADIDNFEVALNPGSYRVATFTLYVDPNTPNGTYSIVPAAVAPEAGWVGEGPSYDEHPFDEFNAATVTVTPEPSFAILIGFGLIGIAYSAARNHRKNSSLGQEIDHRSPESKRLADR